MKQKKIWKKVVLFCTLFALIAGGGFSYFLKKSPIEIIQPISWQAYSPKDQRFNIQFPTDPTETSQELTIANKRIIFRELSTELKGTQYAVSYLDFPPHWKILGANKLLTKSFDAYLENEKNIEQLYDRKLTKYRGYSALEYHLKQEGKEIKGKFVVVGSTLYRITMSYPPLVADSIPSEPFFDSFQVNR